MTCAQVDPPAAGAAPPAWLLPLAPAVVQAVACLAGDLVLALDSQGVVREASAGEAAPDGPVPVRWQGRHWVQTSAADTRGKAERLWRELSQGMAVRQREINHVTEAGGSVAIAWSGLPVGPQGPWLLLGRRLGQVQGLQRELVAAQAALETARWSAYSSPGGASPSPNRRSLT